MAEARGSVGRKGRRPGQLESEKATVRLPAPVAGVVGRIVKGDGQAAEVGEVIGYLDPMTEPQDSGRQAEEPRRTHDGKTPPPLRGESGAASPARTPEKRSESPASAMPSGEGRAETAEAAVSPATRRAGRVPQPPRAAREPVASAAPLRREEAVPMSAIRERIAERLVEAQKTAALLTTFNEIKMSAVIEFRKKFGEAFQSKHGVKLGFMSFFVKAVVESLKECPELNAEVRGTDIIYRNYADVGIAVGGGKGLVVPVLRNAQRMSFAEIELAIADFAVRAQAIQLRPDELSGGTFTITNGGVYGSLLSTPLVTPPQSGILGLHAIQERPVARNGQVVIRPMMYVAVTYDHRIVDGREAVGFLRRIKEIIEEPARMLLEV